MNGFRWDKVKNTWGKVKDTTSKVKSAVRSRLTIGEAGGGYGGTGGVCYYYYFGEGSFPRQVSVRAASAGGGTPVRDIAGRTCGGEQQQLGQAAALVVVCVVRIVSSVCRTSKCAAGTVLARWILLCVVRARSAPASSSECVV